MATDYSDWFLSTTKQTAYSWQERLGQGRRCRNRLISIPTGMGKTLGVLLAWLWHRVEQNDPAWPRRLVWCLPMRVLVEQTVETARARLEELGRFWDGHGSHDGLVGVHALLGGLDVDDWHLHPEQPAVLVGTQDMLLSRALNRGYACGRARWPMEFGLLNQDSLWVLDEVQLMDVGLATGVQLQAFREQDGAKGFRPCRTWWMSATLQPSWLDTVDAHQHLGGLDGDILDIPKGKRTEPLWSVRKPLTVQDVPAKDDKECRRLADRVLKAHNQSEPGPYGRITLAIVNTVKAALALHECLGEELRERQTAPHLHLVHSRFRPLERRRWPERFLARRHCTAEADRIIVATQVVEAGVDITATTLVTELAPWPSLVQRFGRAARYGGTAPVIVVDRGLSGEKECLPYEEAQLAAARCALQRLDDVGLDRLAALEDELKDKEPQALKDLYPYEPLHLLTRRECNELFDTSADLTGADLDISRFIRTGEERDLLVCWADLGNETGDPSATLQPLREGLCPVPVGEARNWLIDKGRLADGCRAWVWDYMEGRWRRLTARDCYPGRIILVERTWGGYDVQRGFTGERSRLDAPPFNVVEGIRDCEKGDERADLAQDFEDESVWPWKTIATHGAEVSRRAVALAQSLGLPSDLVPVLDLAGRLHDWGKAHPAFASSIRRIESHPGRTDIAKAPASAWVAVNDLYCQDRSVGPRRGFRHELASALAILELLARRNRDHAALLGPHRELVQAGVLGETTTEPIASADGTCIADELERLPAEGVNLLAYLVCCHHGKVRGAWQGTPHDQDFPADSGFLGLGQPLRGVREEDLLGDLDLAAADGSVRHVPAVSLHLDPAAMGLSARYGPSWVERVQGLLSRFGPFALAWLETLLRVADIRASRQDTPDPLLGRGGQA